MRKRRGGMLRRTFVKALGLTVGGLALGIFDWEARAEEAGGSKAVPDLRPNVFVHIAPDGTVSIVCHRSEMGQGVRSSLPVLVAGELGADLAAVKIVQADGDPAYGDQSTDGSSSIRANYDGLRLCGATARAMLVTVAAKRWQVPPGECDTKEGFVFHRGGNALRLPFADLVEEAALLPVPAPETVSLRPKESVQYIGKEGLPLADAPEILTGRAVFAADVKLTGMLTAVIARPPVLGGRVATVDSTGALAIAGVRKVLTLPSPAPPYGFQPLGGIAVVADDTWAALRGRAALSIKWETAPSSSYDTDQYRAELLVRVRAPGKPVREKGDVEGALAQSAHRLSGEYFVPHLAHLPMETPCAVAHFRDGACEVWSSTQSPQDTAAQVGQTLGIDPGKVKVHVTLLGGGFGRKGKPDYAAEAAWLSREVGAPVRMQWSREDDIANSYYHTISAQRLEAGLDSSGKLTAFLHRTAFPSILTTFESGVTAASEGELNQGVLDLPFDVPSFRAECGEAEAHLRIGWIRSVCNIQHAFAVGSFLDEIAVARGMDPLDSLLDILGPARKLSSPADFGVASLSNYGEPLSRHPIDVGRYRTVLDRVTRNADWGGRKQAGRAMGLAVHRSFLSYVAVVLSVVPGPRGKIRVDEAWVAADLGTLVNPERVRAQMEGAVIFGMSLALYGGIAVREGAVVQMGFHDCPLVRLAEAPRAIHVDLVESDGLPGGAGEPGVPPTAPALANAIFALTGQRLRALPLL